METPRTVRFCAHTHNFRLLLRHFVFGQKLLSFLVRKLRVSQELFNELRTVKVVLRFPRVLCTVARGGRGDLIISRTRLLIGKSKLHSLGEALPLQEILHSSVQDAPADDFVHRKLLDDRRLLGLPLFGGLLLPHPADNDKHTGGGS